MGRHIDRRSSRAFGDPHKLLLLWCFVAAGAPLGVLAECPGTNTVSDEFLLTFPGVLFASEEGTLAIMAEDETEVEVSIPNCDLGSGIGVPVSDTVDEGTPWIIEVCDDAQYRDDGVGGPEFAIKVTQLSIGDPRLSVAFKAPHVADADEDAFLVLPTRGLGRIYRIMGHMGTASHESQWIAISTGDGLELNYTSCGGGEPAEALDEEELFQDTCSASAANPDATGFLIYASTNEEPTFALISGAEGVDLPEGTDALDRLWEMMPPEEWFGSEYLVTEFNKSATPAIEGDVVRIMALNSSMSATITPVSGGGAVAVDASPPDGEYPCGSTTSPSFAAAGDFCDVHIKKGAKITASTGARLAVGQFMKGGGGIMSSDAGTGVGDPDFLLVTPTSRFTCASRFFAFDGFPFVGLTGDGTYVNVVYPTGEASEVFLDGMTLTAKMLLGLCTSATAFPSSSYSWTECQVSDDAEHVLDATANTHLIGAYVYGQRDHGSYSYPTGFSLPW